MTDEDVTALLQGWRRGDDEAAQRLMSAVARELEGIAGAQLRHERAAHTLEPAALVNEAYVRLIGQQHLDWQSRGHFLAIASREMRRILIDYARQRRAAKRQGLAGERVSLTQVADPAGQNDLDVLALHDALREFAETNRRQADIVELRYFGGLTIEEIAAATGLSPATVKRDLLDAKIWLRERME